MKAIGRLAWVATLGIGIAVGGLRSLATEYYSLQNPDWPPLPFVPFELSVYDLGNGFLTYDDLAVDYDQVRAEAELARRLEQLMENSNPPDPEEGEGQGEEGGGGPAGFNYSTNDLWLEILAVTNSTATLIIHAPGTNAYDLFRTFELTPAPFTNAVWRWVAKGTNGQTLVFPNARCWQALYVLGSGVDSDGDNLTDAFEVLSSKTSPGTNRTYYATGLDDREWWLRSNVLVNDPEQDCETDQNTQGESSLMVFGNTVLVAWVDSNLGVAGYGKPGNPIYFPTNCSCPYSNCPVQTNTPQFIGWAVSRDGGVTFSDRGNLPLFTYVADGKTNVLGNAGDPELACDTNTGVIYLLGNPQRPSVYYPDGTNNLPKLYVPLWRSTNGGESFLPPVNVVPGLTASVTDDADGPQLAVDNFSGVGQGDVYMAVAWYNGAQQPLLVSRSTNGTDWQVMTQIGSAAGLHMITVTPNHEICMVWRQSNTNCPYRPLFFAKSSDRGTNWTTPVQVQCFNTNDFSLPRFTSCDTNDHFRAAMVPRFTANPANGDLYYVYHDKPDISIENPNIYFIQSTNGGANWSERIQVNLETTNGVPTDQWQPALALKPDGTQLFIAWYDRRNDPTNQSLIECGSNSIMRPDFGKTG